MTKNVPETKFFEFNQNNSGGSFDFDEKAGISHYVIIEAESAEAANTRAEYIGLYFNGCEEQRDCDCCGDRWYSAYGNGDPVPSLYGEPITEAESYSKWMKGPEGFVHYLDGRIESFDIKIRKIVPAKGKKTKND